MEDYLKGGWQHYYKLYKDGEVVCYKTLADMVGYLNEQGHPIDYDLLKQYAYAHRSFYGYTLVRTDEKKFNVFTIDFKGKTYTGTSKELSEKLGIDRSSITTKHNQRIEKIERAEYRDRKERERLEDICLMIKHQVSLPPCYKTFYHPSKDDDIIKGMLGGEYKFTHIKDLKEGLNYWEITYADI